MKKSKITAVVMAAVMSAAFIGLPPSDDSGIGVGTAITAYAASTAGAAKNVKTTCSEGTLHITWSKATGADAYQISYKKNDAAKFTTFKTVYKKSVDIPYFSNGDDITVKITSLKKSSSGYTKGKSITFTKTFDGEAAYINDGFFGFDSSLLKQKKATVQKALGVKLKLEDWEWWQDGDGNDLKVAYAYLEDYDTSICLLFDKDNRLYNAWYDLPVTDYTEDFNILAKNYYGKATEWTEAIDNGFAFYDMYAAPNYYYNVYDVKYANDSETVMRQMYFWEG